MQIDDQFFNSIGLANASDEERAGVADQIAELVQTRMAVRVGNMLNEQQAEQFASLSEQGKDEEAFNYLSEIIPQYPQLMEEEITFAKAQLQQDFNEVMTKLNDANGN